MKKVFKITLLILGIILCYQHFSYASTLSIEYSINNVLEYIAILNILCIFILGIILIGSILSYIILKIKTINDENTIRKLKVNKEIIFTILALLIILITLEVLSINVLYKGLGSTFIFMSYLGIILIIISMLSYIILKIKAINEKNSNENIIKKIKINKKIIFIILILLLILISLEELTELESVFLESQTDTINTMGLIAKIGLIVTIIMLLISIIIIIKEKGRAIFVISIIIGMIFINYTDVLQDMRDEDIKEDIGFMTSYEVQMYNNQFEEYSGKKVRGSTVKTLIQTVLANNVSQDGEYYQVNIYGAVTLNKEDTNLSQSGYSEIDTSKTYKVEMNYSKYGKIESIYIEENQ